MIETTTQQGILGCSVFLVFNIDAIKESQNELSSNPQKKLENFFCSWKLVQNPGPKWPRRFKEPKNHHPMKKRKVIFQTKPSFLRFKLLIFQGSKLWVPVYISLAEPTHLKNVGQNGNLPQVGVKMKIKNDWNHHLDIYIVFPFPQKKVYEKSHDFKQRFTSITNSNFQPEKQSPSLKWATKKNLITVHYTGWLIGISVMGYNKPYNKG